MSALRPSNLPKLAVCPCYESNPVAGPAAERGTLLDTAFRAELLGLEERLVIANKLTADEIAAVAWSVSMVRAISGREQMAAYALGLMGAYFAGEWTAHLLFCDQREIETIKFTYEEAHDIVDQVVKSFNDPAKKPNPCEYCAWCAKADTPQVKPKAAPSKSTAHFRHENSPTERRN